jgi:NADPH:quinone reductase-like Zn-dependent oxidoreductase
VAATAGAPDRMERCRELGADIVIDYHDDVPARLKEATDGHGADVILDNMGAKGLAANIDALAHDGRLLILGFQGGTKAEINLGKLLAKRGSVTAMGLRGRPVEGPNGKGVVVAGVRDQMWPLFADGRVTPVVHTSVALPDAGAAHARLEEGGVVGKILLPLT